MMKPIQSNLATVGFCAAVAFSTVVPNKAVPAPVVWPLAEGGNGHAYEAVSASVTWSEADASATAAGGYLATIHSVSENQFVFALVDSNEFWTAFNEGYFWGPWLGGRQEPASREPDGGWGWTTGEPFEYTNWRPGEPNNLISAGFQEDSLHFFSSPSGTREATWNDFYDHPALRLNGYVIEYIPEPSTVVLTALGLLGLLSFSGRPRLSRV